jgi:DNA-binding GntR family transcriptional regulator
MISLSSRFGQGPNRIAAIIDQHRRLVQAIQRRDPVQAVAVAQEHCESAKEDLLRQMDQAATVTPPRGKTPA